MRMHTEFQYLSYYKNLSPLGEKEKDNMRDQLIKMGNMENLGEPAVELTALMLLFRFHHHDNGDELMQEECLKLLAAFCNKNKTFPSFNDCCGFIKNRNLFYKDAIPKRLGEVYKQVKDKDLLMGYLKKHEKTIENEAYQSRKGTKDYKLRHDHNSFKYLFDFIAKHTETTTLLDKKIPQSAAMYSQNWDDYNQGDQKYCMIMRRSALPAREGKVAETWGPWLEAFSKNPVFQHCVEQRYVQRTSYVKQIFNVLGNLPFDEYVLQNGAGQYLELKNEADLIKKFEEGMIAELNIIGVQKEPFKPIPEEKRMDVKKEPSPLGLHGMYKKDEPESKPQKLGVDDSYTSYTNTKNK